MILEQYYLGCLSQASYLIGDEQSGVAAVVDPRRDVDLYLEEAARRELAIRHVLLTHFHADFLAGHIELRERTGATIHLGAQAEAEYDFQPMRDGEGLEFGRVRLGFLETPGHTPESVTILVFDLEASPERPAAALTGDTLFIGDVGRPDLMASQGVSAAELAGQLYDSLWKKILTLPDETRIYPGHGAGSACGKSLSEETVSTLGEQRRLNYALQPMDREAFVRLATAGQPAAPAYFAYDAGLNRRERPTLDEALEAAFRPLSLEALLALRARGAQILDARDPAGFAAGHLEGSLNIGLDGRFADWAGRLLDRERPIVVIAPEGREREAVLRLGRIGFDHVAGFLEGGARAWEGSTEGILRNHRHTADSLAAACAASEPPLILDVRGPAEREQVRIEDSLHIPLPELAARVSELPRRRPLVVHCAGGYRSMIALGVLEQAGFAAPADLAGGINAWQEAARKKKVAD